MEENEYLYHDDLPLLNTLNFVQIVSRFDVLLYS